MYSELCEKLFEQNANNYIAVFNDLDKYFDTLVDTEKFMPYNEKVRSIWYWTSSVALFVKKHEVKLKYFGELRNHIAHGFKLDGKHYAIPSYHALDELGKYKDAIMKPITVGAMFKKNVYNCFLNDPLKDVMISMKNFGYTHVPVFNEKHELQWVLTQSAICEWLAYHMQDPEQAIESVQVSVVDLNLWIERYWMIAENTPLFTAPQLFEPSGLHQKRLWVLLMTETGNAQEPLTGLITTFDLPLISQHNFTE